MKSFYNGKIIILDKSDKREFTIAEKEMATDEYKLKRSQSYNAELIVYFNPEMSPPYEVIKGRHIWKSGFPMFITKKELTKKLLQYKELI